jgi:hypothetical protein
MAVKKSVAPKKAPSAETRTEKKPAPLKVWALPVAMLMLVIAAAGLSFALRESSNKTEAATPSATAAVMTPEGESKAPKTVKASNAPAPAAAVTGSPKPETTASAAAKPVSITGCLQRNEHGFLLKDTEGADAPKSRSWKSGFLKRSSSSILLSDAAGAHLADHVGQRVSVTGPLAEREMRVVSLRRLSASCE